MVANPKFQIYLNFYRLKSSTGEIILTGEGYATKLACIKGIEDVKASAARADRYDRMISSRNEYYFILRSHNGEWLGKSEMYSTPRQRDEGIDAVSQIAQAALVEEFAELAECIF